MPWIFGYASLIFRPGFEFVESTPALVHGYERRLDQGSPDHRGTPSAPGRVATLILKDGATCGGCAYRIEGPRVDEVLTDLDLREKGGYERVEVELTRVGSGKDGERFKATTWIAPPGNPWYLGPTSIEAMVETVSHARGMSGPNKEYVLKLAEVLRELGFFDPAVADLAKRLVGEGRPSS